MRHVQIVCRARRATDDARVHCKLDD